MVVVRDINTMAESCSADESMSARDRTFKYRVGAKTLIHGFYFYGMQREGRGEDVVMQHWYNYQLLGNPC